MAICQPCANAADTDQRIAAEHGTPTLGHDRAICRDHGRTPNGCGCAHRPAGTATPQPAPIANTEGHTR
ncbi:hypothetical protein [Actinoallomurus sp. CA-142502]|uniref:hypothetical protein n=1 Tax=Actinoallomurus sp. CA-142502 TaxID=3239885 RepID=UPI003D8D72EE